MKIFNKISLPLICIFVISMFTGCLFKNTIYPITTSEIETFKNKIIEYASENGYILENEYNALTDNNNKSNYSEKQKYNKDILDQTVAFSCELVKNKTNKIIQFDLRYSGKFYIELNGFTSSELDEMSYEIIDFTNRFSKIEITSKDLKEFFESDTYKKDEYVKNSNVDFWGDATLSYQKECIIDGVTNTPTFCYSNVIKF